MLLTKDNLQLQARQWLGDAAVRTKAKAERIRCEFSMQVKGVRIREDIFVSVGGLVRRDNSLAGFYVLREMYSLVYAATRRANNRGQPDIPFRRARYQPSQHVS